MNWNQIVEKIKPYIVKIETPTGSGTGFLCFYNKNKKWCGISTALHVVSDADEWQQPIRIVYHGDFEVSFLKESQRIIFPDYKTDSAVIFFEKPLKTPFPNDVIPLQPIDKPLEARYLRYRQPA